MAKTTKAAPGAKDAQGAKKEAPAVKKEAQGAQEAVQGGPKFTPTFKTEYKERIVPALMKEFGYKSIMQVPKLEKIVVNQGMGQAVADKKLIDVAIAELTQITGQKAVQTRSKKDISNFKLRKGMPIGVRVTLRAEKMYEFMERLVAVALPRIRDFKGINEKFDGRGNYTLGITEQIIFPEIDIDKITKILGREITFVTSTDSDQEAYALLREFGLPFKNAKKAQ
jgi:large subunit ribosomal protein L5